MGNKNQITGLTQLLHMVMFQSVMKCAGPLGSCKCKVSIVSLVFSGVYVHIIRQNVYLKINIIVVTI